jgi:hypothetical protein
MSDGYGYWWAGNYIASLKTSADTSATRQDVLFNVVGNDTHGHTWVIAPGDTTWAQGMQLKDRGEHLLPDGHVRSFTTQPVFRARIERMDTRDVRVSLAAVGGNSAVSAAPVTSIRTGSGRSLEQIQLPIPADATWADLEVSMVRLEQTLGGTAATEVVVPFGPGAPTGITIRVTRAGAGSPPN